MPTIAELHERVEVRHRAARHLLAEKGDRRWSANDQAMFDALLDDAERTQAQLDARRALSGSAPMLWAEQRAGVELFIRKDRKSMNDSDTRRVQNAMSTTTGSEGGYAVGSYVAEELLSIAKGYGWMRQVASQLTTTKGGNYGQPTSDGTGEVGEQVAQNVAVTVGDMTFNTRPLPVYKYSSKLFTVPLELLQDPAVDIVVEVGRRAVERVGRIQNQKFTTGTGTNEPNGLVTAASVGKVGNTGQTVTVLYDDLVDLADSLDDAHLGMPSNQPGMPVTRPGWMMSQVMRKVVRKLKDTNNRPIWMPATGGEPAQLLDYPVHINNDMPAPAANAKSIAFGDLHSYRIRDVLEFVLLRMDDSAFALAGQVGFLGWMRSGANLMDLGAVKLYQHSAT